MSLSGLNAYGPAVFRCAILFLRFWSYGINGMRLSPEHAATISRVVQRHLGASARVYLFGSRIDDEARGGDIDLLVVSDEPVADPQRATLTLTARLQRRLGDQPIDVLLIDPETTMQPVHQEALRTGVPL